MPRIAKWPMTMRLSVMEGEETIGFTVLHASKRIKKRRRPECLNGQMRQAIQGRRSRQQRVKVVGAFAPPLILAAILHTFMATHLGGPLVMRSLLGPLGDDGKVIGVIFIAINVMET